MPDMNNIKDAVFNTIGNVVEKTMDIAGKTADKAKDVARIAKLNVELKSEKGVIEEAYLEIGKLYYDTHKNAPDSFFAQLCDEVNLAGERVAKLQSEIDLLKVNGSGSCAKNDDGSIEVEFTELSPEEADFVTDESPKDVPCEDGCCK